MTFAFHPVPETESDLLLVPAQTLAEGTPVRTKDDAVRILAGDMKQLDREEFRVLCLDEKERPIHYSVVSIGSAVHVPVVIGNVFKPACLAGASFVLLLHNHPSGVCDPSRKDEDLTRQAAETGRMLGVPVLDHLIVGGRSGELYSFREHKPGCFPPDTPAPYTGETRKTADRPSDRTGLVRMETRFDPAAPALVSGESILDDAQGVRVLWKRLTESGPDRICFVEMDTRMRPVRVKEVPADSVSASYFTVGALLKDAFLHSAAWCAVYREGDPYQSASEDDRRIARRLSAAGTLAGVPLLAYAIWNRDGYLRNALFGKKVTRKNRINYRYLSAMAAEPD